MVKAKLIIDGKEINVLWFTFSFNQGGDYSGRPSQRPVFVGLKLIIETRKDLNLADWSFAANQTKQLELHIYPVILGGKTRKLYFYDCHLVNWNNHFSSTGNQPMSETLHITAAGVKDSNSTAEYSAYWRTTFPQQEVEQTTLNNEPEIINYHIEDLEGNELSKDEIEVGEEIMLIIESNNAIGETFEFDLDDQKLDYEHNGIKLKDDILEIVINKDVQHIPLKAILQEN